MLSMNGINKRYQEKVSSRKPLYCELSSNSLNDRRWSRKLFFLHKFMKGFFPSYLQKTFKFVECTKDQTRSKSTKIIG